MLTNICLPLRLTQVAVSAISEFCRRFSPSTVLVKISLSATLLLISKRAVDTMEAGTFEGSKPSSPSSTLTRLSQTLTVVEGTETTALLEDTNEKTLNSVQTETRHQNLPTAQSEHFMLQSYRIFSWFKSAWLWIAKTVASHTYLIGLSLTMAIVCIIGINLYLKPCDDCGGDGGSTLQKSTIQLLSATTDLPGSCVANMYNRDQLLQNVKEMRDLDLAVGSFYSALEETRLVLEAGKVSEGSGSGSALYGAAYNLSSLHRPLMNNLKTLGSATGQRLWFRPSVRHLILDHLAAQTRSFLWGGLSVFWADVVEQSEMKRECIRSLGVWMRLAQEFKAACDGELMRQEDAIGLLKPFVDGKPGYQAMSGEICDSQCHDDLQHALRRLLDVFRT